MSEPTRMATENELPLQKATLSNWTYLGGYLYGEVEGHPKLKGTQPIRTSQVRFLDRELGIAVTCNTVYILTGDEKPV